MSSPPPLPPLPCPSCGTIAPPRLERGTGPHSAKAVCVHCNRFIKWLPRRLTQPPAKAKETERRRDVNRVVLHGTIGPSGVEVSNDASGAPCASFTLEVQESGQDGQASSKLIPCKLFGAKAESAVELEAGQLVRVEGKLKKRQKGDQWELIGSGFEVTPVLAPTSASELPGSNERVPEA
jgi:hypothetical protein